MKSTEPSIETSKRSRGEASATAPTSGAMPNAEETFCGLDCYCGSF